MRRPAMPHALLLVLTLSLAAPAAAQYATLLPEPPAPEILFGAGVALSADGRTALVGAQSDDHGDLDPNMSYGAAYVLVQEASGWRQEAKLVAPVPQRFAYFGRSVALSADGQTALVGAYSEEEAGERTGAAYVFARTIDGWTLETRLLPTRPGDQFGEAVALSADGATALIGAGTSNANGSYGAAYVLVREDGVWTEQALLAADDPDAFGVAGALALSADGTTATLGIGDVYCLFPDCVLQRTAYVFRRTGTEWNREDPLTHPEATNAFGRELALSEDGGVAAVGDPGWEKGRGRVYGFSRRDSLWQHAVTLDAPTAERRIFGNGLALDASGTRLAVGEPGGTDHTGNVYLYRRLSDGLVLEDVLPDPSGGSPYSFGSDVALSHDGGVLLAGDPGEDGLLPNGGAAYVYGLRPVAAEPSPVGATHPGLSVRPHPVSSAAALEVTLPHPGHVRLTLYDVLGRIVAEVFAGSLPAGTHPLALDASGLPAGLYVLHLRAEASHVTQRLVIAR